MASVTGWYGPLIDLSQASSHIGHFVQLLVFIRGSTPVQYKLSKGGEATRTDVQVCDDTRQHFFISVWQKQLGSAAVGGRVVLFQNVKIVKFGEIVQGTTVQCSSLLCLVYDCESLVSKGTDEVISDSSLGNAAIIKFRKVIDWLLRAQPFTFRSTKSNFSQVTPRLWSFRWYSDASYDSSLNFYIPFHHKILLSRNWKLVQETKTIFCFTLPEVLRLKTSCKATFDASVGEIFLPVLRTANEFRNENMFISRRLMRLQDNNSAEDLICTGCQLCGCPLDQDHHRYIFSAKFDPLYCEKSSNHLHVVTWIYRPFMLHVWDEYEYMPLLVRNKAAELLFGNIRAEQVYESYRQRKQVPDMGRKISLEKKDGSVDVYAIWLIILKILLRRGKNGPLRFEAAVNSGLNHDEFEKFEMTSVSTPCKKRYQII